MKLLIFCAIFLKINALDEVDRDCAKEGQQIQLGSAWYECRLAKYVPVACITSSGARVDIEQSYISNDLLVKCTQTSPSSISFQTVGCFSKGLILKPGETAHDNNFWFLCSQQGGVLQVQMPGCLGPNDAVVNVDGIVERGTFRYKCTSGPDGKLSLSPVGCTFNNKQYSLDDTIETTEGFWYKCVSSGPNDVHIQMMGCISDGKKINDGEQFASGGFKATCRVKPVLTQSDVSDVKSGMSCIEFGPTGQIDHPVGSTWTVGSAPIKYVIQCTQESLTIKKRTMKCFYDGPGGQGEVETGCYKKFGSTILQCTIKNFKDADAQIINQASESTEQQLQSKGFKNC